MSEAVSPWYRWQVLACVIFGLFMVLLDTTAVNVAFATLQREFVASVSASQWVISLYTMALGIGTPLAGYLGDRFGQKRMFLTALSAFVVGSLLCGLAPNLGLLIGAALVGAPALGPILGGWLIDLGLWRWIFFINVPIGLIGVSLGSLLLRPDHGQAQVSFDTLGLVTSAVGFGSVLYAASIAADHGWAAPNVLIWFAVGAITLALFAWVELKVAKKPLLDLRLFGKPVFLSAALVGYVSVVALFGAEFLMPLYLQVLRGRTALEAGLLLLPLALTAAVAAPIAGILFDRVGARPLTVTGFTLLAINTWQFTALTPETDIGWVQLLLALRGVALGLTVHTTVLAGLSVVPVAQTAQASALVNATRQVFQSLGVAILATVLASALSPELTAKARDFQARFPAQAAAGPRVELCQLTAPAAPLPAEAKAAIDTFCSEYTTGLANAYRLTFYFSLLAVALAVTLPGWPSQRLATPAPKAPQD